ncbi:uncharacterized protein N7473_010846 [Penicillium subrubescens]|uniref:uncharacterized protein n=1 Tax=Penicillium subrubescens TaxID=1316194 RepID=UPI002544FCC8|nr:uncharacterized protein N7473_010846 [Penicillium subrubescens]KAJ5883960.1 hypothetical protein N7473_010846 [Penicillium subrubescens]
MDEDERDGGSGEIPIPARRMMILTPAQGNDPPPRGYKGRHRRETRDKWEGLRSDGDKEASGGLHGWLDGRERVAPCKQPKQLATPKVDKSGPLRHDSKNFRPPATPDWSATWLTFGDKLRIPECSITRWWRAANPKQETEAAATRLALFPPC